MKMLSDNDLEKVTGGVTEREQELLERKVSEYRLGLVGQMSSEELEKAVEAYRTELLLQME